MRNQKESTLNNLIDNYLDLNKISVKTAFSTSDYDVQIGICSTGMAAAFCPSLIVKRVLEHNKNCKKGEEICVCSIDKFSDLLNIDFVYNKSITLPTFTYKFMDMMRKEYDKISLVVEESI